jgi:hypothetical protein
VAACSLRAAERIANAFSKSISFVSSLSPPTYGRSSTSVLISTRPENASNSSFKTTSVEAMRKRLC